MEKKQSYSQNSPKPPIEAYDRFFIGGPASDEDKDLERLLHDMDIHIIGRGQRPIAEVGRIDAFMLPSFLLIQSRTAAAEITHGGRSTRLEKGSVYLFLPFETYSIVPGEGADLSHLFIYFEVSPFSARMNFVKHARPWIDALFVQSWYQRVGQILFRFFDGGLPQIGMESILQYLVKGILVHVLYDLINQEDAAPFDYDTPETSLIDQAFTYTRDHLDEPINIGAVVRAVGTSRSTLNRVFSTVLQLTPTRALTRYKMEKAIELMVSGASVKQAADALGYSSTFHFSDTFKSVMGQRPREFMHR